jgi:PAS domain S-box-containing protein
MPDDQKTIATVLNELDSLRRQITALEAEREQWNQTKATLQSTEEYFRQFVQSISDHIYVTEISENKKFRNIYLSPHAESLTGYPLAKLLADWSFWGLHLIHPDDRSIAAVQAARLAAGKDGEVEYRLVRADGQIIWVRDSATVKNSGPTSTIYGLVSDITERKHRETALTRLLELSRTLVTTYDPRLLIEQATTMALDIIPVAEQSSLQLLTETDQTLQTVAVSPGQNPLPNYQLDQAALDIAGQSIATQKLINIPDLLTLDRPGQGKLETSASYRALLVAPLLMKGRTLGTLSLYSSRPAAFSTTAETLLQFIADQIAVTLENAHLFAKHKTAETALQKSEEKYRTLTNQLPIGVYRTTETGQIIYANSALAAILGYDSVEELMQVSARQIFSDPTERDRQLEQWKNSRHIVSNEMEFRQKNGQLIWIRDTGRAIFDENGNFAYFDGTIEDITARKRAAEILAQNEARFRSLIQNSSDVILILDMQGQIQYISPPIQRILGYTPTALIGQNAFNYIHPEDSSPVLARFRQKLQDSIPTNPIEFRMRHLDGHWVWLEVMGNNLLDDPNIKGIVVNGRDISERKQAEEQLRSLEQQFLQAQKMEAIGRLAGGVAHDFNNLLTVISSYSDFLLEALNQTDPLRLDVEQIKKAGDRAASLTRQLLIFSRRQIVEPQILDLNQVITDLAKMLPRLIGEHIHLTINLDPALGPVKADLAQLEQVILNLVVNARDAMTHGGQLLIQTTNLKLETAATPVHAATLPPGPYTLLTIRDTGAGIQPQNLPHIFEPFFTTKQPTQGTGLGLFTVYAIVSQTGGGVSVHSTPSQGTTFSIYLPQPGPPETEPKQETPPASTEPGRGEETILLVEDDPLVRDLAARILQQKGYHVLVAEHGQAALHLNAQYPAPIDLLLTDLVMPAGLDGHELAQQLQTLRPALKVIYMSGYIENSAPSPEPLTQNSAFIQKPFTPTALAHLVRQTLDK